jgi:beta-galactosidase
MLLHFRLRVSALFATWMLLVACCSVSPLVHAESPVNDHMFRAAESARSTIDYDARGFLIHGQRTFIVSAGMEYARIPHQLWRDRLLRLKRGGFNTVEIYTFWNFHEPQEGQFDFSGDHDLNAFLKLVRELDMYVIARVGPYYCAEWDQGGYPLWLRFKPDVLVRQPNAAFERYVDRFFDKLIPIIAANQINRGGAVILVQLENEHPAGWGTDMPNSYFAHLRDKAVSLGVEVPYFFSGLHHANDPAGDLASFDDPARPNPWFSTEFWSVWYDHYGAEPTDATVFGRRAWKMIAHGGNGYNVYMAHGGTNFGYTNNHEDAASYDYGAAVGQAGDLRPLYYAFKQAAWFSRSFSNILENSTDATVGAPVSVSNPNVKLTARRSPSGTVLFLDNPTGSEQESDVTLSTGATAKKAHFVLAPSEIIPLLSRAQLTEGVAVDWSASRILGTASAGNQLTLVAYGPPRSAASFDFATEKSPQIQTGESSFQKTPGGLHLGFSFPEQGPAEYTFTVGAKRVRVLAVSQRRADATWFVDLDANTYVISGPSYVGDARIQAGRVQLRSERPWQSQDALMDVIAYGPSDAPQRLSTNVQQPAHITSLQTAPWRTASASQPASIQFNDRGWTQSTNPEQMGTDGDLTADAWYRTSVDIASPGKKLLRFDRGGDRATIFVDGAAAGKIESHSPALLVDLSAGKHSVAVFTAHDGRNKLYNFLGSLAQTDAKGLAGAAVLWDDAVIQTPVWRTAPANWSDNPPVPPGIDSPAWQIYADREDVFHRKSDLVWFMTTINRSAAKHLILEFPGMNQDITVFLNGAKVATHPRWSDPFSLSLDTGFQPGSSVSVTLLARNYDAAGGVSHGVRLISYNDEHPVTDWRMRGGTGIVASSGWHDLKPNEHFDGPQFFQTTFDLPSTAPQQATAIWRVVVAGMGHGSVWVNGHNLGRYPERIPVNGLYIPECWLQPTNTLEIYDEDGDIPSKVSIQAEAAASRDSADYISQE